jgi:hypothetical protein
MLLILRKALRTSSDGCDKSEVSIQMSQTKTNQGVHKLFLSYLAVSVLLVMFSPNRRNLQAKTKPDTQDNQNAAFYSN